jgi:predicted metal-dependent phosphoesterase TrpH
MKFDLHVHTKASDGNLPPLELFALAGTKGVQVLALTDHDTLEGYLEVAEYCQHTGNPDDPYLISGIELSACWSNQGVHIVGLDFDPSHDVMQAGVAQQQDIRKRRGQMIADRLAKKGMSGTYEGALKFADGNPAKLGRPHFARYLVEKGLVKTPQKAFDRWLGSGKVADIRNLWPGIEEVVGWIVESGGVAVLAHPLKYKMTNAKLGRLVEAFKACGGQAMEVVVGGQNADRTAFLATLANRHGLLASGGSDFHDSNNRWRHVGGFAPLPRQCDSVLGALRIPQALMQVSSDPAGEQIS